MTGEGFTLAEIREKALSSITLMELGGYRFEGVHENILHLESWSSWNTLVNELSKEGFVLVTPGEFSEITGLTDEEVDARIRKHGTLFTLLYISGPVIHCAVPLDRREIPEGPGPLPAS
jgi:hypothetical protein